MNHNWHHLCTLPGIKMHLYIIEIDIAYGMVRYRRYLYGKRSRFESTTRRPRTYVTFLRGACSY